ncbi:MAG: hypothetical protein KC646_16285 [Candidatus Cloacimonetes bacterium]|nr:hypothetical protein [Candidatus Cloacimonadota bacterium]
MFLIKYIFLPCILLSTVYSARQVRLEYKRDSSNELQFNFKNEYRVVHTDMDEIHRLHAISDGVSHEKVTEENFEGKTRISKKIVVNNLSLNGNEDNKVSPELLKLANYEYLLDKHKGNVQIVGSKDFRRDDLMNMNIVFPKKALRSGDTWKAKYKYFFNLGKRGAVPVFGKFQLVSIVDGYAKIIGNFVGKIDKTRKINYKGLVKLSFDMKFDIVKGYFTSGKMKHSLRYESRTDLANDLKKFTSGATRLGYKLDYKTSFELKRD